MPDNPDDYRARQPYLLTAAAAYDTVREIQAKVQRKLQRQEVAVISEEVQTTTQRPSRPSR